MASDAVSGPWHWGGVGVTVDNEQCGWTRSHPWVKVLSLGVLVVQHGRAALVMEWRSWWRQRRGGVTTNLTRRFVQFEIEVSKVLFIMSSDWVRNDNRRHVVL